MSIRRFFNQDIVVRRARDIAGTDKSSFQSTATVEGHIQALDVEHRQRLDIIEEKAWIGWFPVDATIQDGDRITDENGIIYNVREVVTKSYGINQHKEVILMIQNA